MSSSENLIFLLNKLSYHIVARALIQEENDNQNAKDEKFFKMCVNKIRQKGCDVLLGKSIVAPLPDPCVTNYGGNWSPFVLLSDYGKELEFKGGSKLNSILSSSVKCLEEKEYNYANELLKFLLMIKGPFFDPQVQSEVSKSRSSFSISPMNSLSILLDEPHINDVFNNQSSFKKAIKYEESWTKTFDTKFQVLGEFSKKNILTPEKVSFDSLFSAKSAVPSQSQTNSFVFTDFCIDKNCQSEKNVFDLGRSSCSNEVPLLDSFVDNPISHKLPNLVTSQKGISKSSYLMRSSEQMKRKLHLLKEEDQLAVGVDAEDSLQDTDISDKTQGLSKTSVIELKRNSNCSHSFAILYEKNIDCQREDPSMSSNDSLILVREKRKSKLEKHLISHGSHSSSREIVLGLWEHDKSILQEFCPELASSMPTLRMITTVEFVEDVKYLLTGINSGSFQYNTKENCFNMQYGTCLSDVTPESLFHFSKEFIETGNYYVKLSTFATENGKSNYKACTTINQAFWKSIFDYLELHYSTVLAIHPTTNLMMLKTTIKDIYEMIVTISNICNVITGSNLPEGGQLLTYLLQIVEKIHKPCVKNIVFGILQNCCTVYFKCILQPWIFKGHLEKENNEFFVEFSKQKMDLKSRTYYKSFFIARDKIPSFLLGFEDSIFNCGKSIHFLKLFNIEDKFCQLLEKSDYPNMYLCVSEAELENLEKQFREYGNKVVEICGEGVSIRSIRNDEKEKEKRYLEYVKECKTKQEKERERAKLRELEELKAKKELQNKLLNEEITKMRAEREKKKMEEEDAIKKIEEKIKKAADNEKDIIKKEKKLIINYYDELMKTLDKELNIIEKRKKNLQTLISNTIELSEGNLHYFDIVNDNKRKQKAESQKLDSNGDKSKAEAELVDLNSNPITSEFGLMNSTDSLSNSLLSLKGSDGVRTGDDNVVIIDQNSNLNSTLYSSRLTLESEEHYFQTNATTFREYENEKTCKKDKEEIWRSVSQRNVAANEALRNKIKVLKSEFGISNIDAELQCNSTSQNSLVCISDSKTIKNGSEYNILTCESDVIKVKPVVSHIDIIKESKSFPKEANKCEGNICLKNADSICLKDALNFREVSLERKRECFNLEKPSEELKLGNADVKITNSESFSSFITPPNEKLSEENVSTSHSDEEMIPNSSQGTNSVINEKYQNALVRDSEISSQNLVYDDIFESLNHLEFEKLPCTELMEFQRYLKKSAIIPLMIQEKLASDALLKHLLVGENLLSHLKSLRSFFFLNDGEFGRSFTYNTFRSLAKCIESSEFFERSNLSDIVNEALNYTIHGGDKNTQNLSFKIVKMPPFLNHSSHDVLSPFELSYKVNWPLNIILTEKALSKYKSIFKFLLKLKRIIWTLNENFLYLNSFFKNKKINSRVLMGSPQYHKIQIYRHAMAQIIITLDDYIFSNGIQLPWLNFLKDLETTSNIDHLYQKHVRYIKDILLRCFLTESSKDLLNYIYSVVELGLKFHYTAISTALQIVDCKYEHPKFHVLKSTFNEFCLVIKTFLRTLKEKIAAKEITKSHYVLIEKFDMKLT